MATASLKLENLFIFEMANNHQGDMEHAKRIIREVATLAREFELRAGIKFQFRDLETLIHPEYQNSKTLKHVPRFYSTRLSIEQYGILKEEVEREGLLSICTPFDEISVDHAVALDFDILKIASCSANDWPLLKKMSGLTKPIVLSTAGLAWNDVETAVSMLERGPQHSLAILHCVALYPTPEEHLQLHRIAELRARFPHLTIGYSTHESPDNMSAIQMAYAAGARLFEKHVAIPHETSQPNSYSAQPHQLRQWLESYKRAVVQYGSNHSLIIPEEQRALSELKRGVYAKTKIAKGDVITRDSIYFALPYVQAGHLSAGDWTAELEMNLTADRDYEANEAVFTPTVHSSETAHLRLTAEKVMSLLREHHVVLPKEAKGILSYHYGVEKMEQTGAALFTIYNRAYCKKIIVMLAGQTHPEHKHLEREETFQILGGQLDILLDGKTHRLEKNDIFHIPAGTWHSFSSAKGAIVEEISLAYSKGDSIYRDEKISLKAHDLRQSPIYP